jgi:hypothetical protein
MKDARGPGPGGSARSLQVYEQALRALNCYRGDPVTIIELRARAAPITERRMP